MQIYQYCLCLLAFIVIVINSRYIQRSYDSDQDEDYYIPNNNYLIRNYRPSSFDRYLRSMVVADLNDDYKTDELASFARRTKAITKGDPREFMG